MPESDTNKDLEKQTIEYLTAQGYQVTKEAKRRGESGIEHTFDMVAQKDDGFISYIIAIRAIAGGDKKTEARHIFDFANKSFDAGIRERVLVASPGLSPDGKQLAEKQRIKVIDGEQMKALLELQPKASAKPREPIRYDTKEHLVESLVNIGYRVREKAKVRGKSGVEYTFDILANMGNEQISSSLVIDIFMNGEKQVGLERVSLFDTKAYDAGIDNKAIMISGELSPDASQFAVKQGIRVLQLGQKRAPQPKAVEGKPDKAEEKPGQQPVKLSRQKIQPEVLKLIPEVTARRYNVMPLNISGNTLEVAMADATDIFALEALSAQSRMRVKPVASDAKEVREAIDFNYKGYSDIEQQVSQVQISSETTDEKLAAIAAIDAPLVKALNLIIEEAVKARTSDIHIEPEEDRLRIRYRIDGFLHDTLSLPLNIHRALISRLKILANLNIADHFRPQDGEFSLKAKGREIDIRVATAPTVNGEMAVLRLLDKSVAMKGLPDLGLTRDNLTRYQNLLKIPYGMILVSGPTGSGKTTTLYASVNTLDSIGRNIITIEDPAEYKFKDINQIQVNPQAGITFASGLRSILRLDPNVVLVGEIRDRETAGIAVQAALTGHLMLSSIHANTAVGALFRLRDLGVEPFLIASSIIGIIAQRMVRRVCPDCSRPIEAPLLERTAYEREMGEVRTEFIYGTGCETCAYSGYLGRVGVFEILSMTDNIRMMVISGASISEMYHKAIEESMVPLIKDGMQKVKAGITTPTEVLRVAYTPE